MKKLVWIFGSSSDFSKSMNSELEKQGYSTYLWGRGNCNYNSFDNFIEDKIVPDIIIWNANIEEQISFLIEKLSDIAIESVRDTFMNYTPLFTFLMKLVKWTKLQNKQIDICSISSSITAWPFKEDKYIMYSVLRGMAQQIVFSASNSTCNAFCVSPSNINDINKAEYSKRIVELLQQETDLKLIDLSMEDAYESLIDIKKFKNE